MNILSQEARRRQAVVKPANRKGKKSASERYDVSLSSVKRWCRRRDGTWQSLCERSHRLRSHPAQPTEAEEAMIRETFAKFYYRYGWHGMYKELGANGYSWSFSGMVHAAKRLGLKDAKKTPRKNERKYPEILVLEGKGAD